MTPNTDAPSQYPAFFSLRPVVLFCGITIAHQVWQLRIRYDNGNENKSVRKGITYYLKWISPPSFPPPICSAETEFESLCNQAHRFTWWELKLKIGDALHNDTKVRSTAKKWYHLGRKVNDFIDLLASKINPWNRKTKFSEVKSCPERWTACLTHTKRRAKNNHPNTTSCRTQVKEGIACSYNMR